MKGPSTEVIEELRRKGYPLLKSSEASSRQRTGSQKEISGRLQDKTVFGTDYPLFRPDKMLADLEAMFPPQICEKIFINNAQRILKIGI